MFVHQEEYCAQCATWSSSSGQQETCADIFHTRMAGISHTVMINLSLTRFILYDVIGYNIKIIFYGKIEGKLLIIALCWNVLFSERVLMKEGP